jgi:DsbC/DsbD-like thiol-disulfide interchange protein
VKRRLIVLAFVAATSAASSAQGITDPITWALAVQPAGASSKPGGMVTLALTATIDEGWHLYAIKLEPGGPVPTTITIPDGQVFSAAGDIVEPLPASSFDGNFNKILEYHENKAVFVVPVKSAATTPAGKQTARVTASYQTCNDRLCLPARSVTVTTEVQIAK